MKILLLAALLSGCGSIDVRWIQPKDLPSVCGPETQGCFKGRTVYAVEPGGFDDRIALCVLGHEVYHVMGGRHNNGTIGC